MTGTDTSTSPGGAESVLAGVRRLTLLAEGAANSEVILRALARELLALLGAEEIHVHHLAEAGVEEELAANVPRLLQAGAASGALLVPLSERGEVEAVVVLVRRLSDPFAAGSVELAATLVDQAAAAALRRSALGRITTNSSPP